MAILCREEVGAYALIRSELETTQAHLRARQEELENYRRLVLELETTCVRLRDKITQLERDKKALDRGNIAIMGSNAV